MCHFTTLQIVEPNTTKPSVAHCIQLTPGKPNESMQCSSRFINFFPIGRTQALTGSTNKDAGRTSRNVTTKLAWPRSIACYIIIFLEPSERTSKERRYKALFGDQSSDLHRVCDALGRSCLLFSNMTAPVWYASRNKID
jgi:hypothetical protein